MKYIIIIKRISKYLLLRNILKLKIPKYFKITIKLHLYKQDTKKQLMTYQLKYFQYI